ncbi:prepilin-type N-terminal cleavage/methylation domain-containing protein [Echinimonas agarilytica]|uniref:Prepilin-type N-terminal cleavage/methylation domain-containing protein n=1 Tax=Echinimonas agarilytica TaxID=1215918 RepID=A0AA41W496_9GAMM|nr:prepilin-type N-terminal cleavage/methylation domain-containing protein [Echinimonas agarilytica]MCM2678589.1 prepilin-type N-terminal cleavage/methylation domain-containing protein [Echinimonas agarilytica]
MLCKGNNGFTLIELVVGIVVMAIAMLIITGVLAPQARNTVDPVMDVKASELAQTMMNEILAKSYDENSDHDGSRWRCSEVIPGIVVPACGNGLGPEEANRVLYNDVDDFDTGGAFISGNDLLNSSGQIIGDLYPNFAVRIDVSHDATAFDGAANAIDIAKRIDVIVRVPSGREFVFSAYRGNY